MRKPLSKGECRRTLVIGPWVSAAKYLLLVLCTFFSFHYYANSMPSMHANETGHTLPSFLASAGLCHRGSRACFSPTDPRHKNTYIHFIWSRFSHCSHDSSQSGTWNWSIFTSNHWSDCSICDKTQTKYVCIIHCRIQQNLFHHVLIIQTFILRWYVMLGQVRGVIVSRVLSILF